MAIVSTHFMSNRARVRVLLGCAIVTFLCAVVAGIGFAMNVGYAATEGTVLSNNIRTVIKRRGSEIVSRERQVCPRVRFQASPNLTREFTALHACADAARYKVGQKITVYYRPKDPADANTNAPQQAFNLMIVCLLVSILCLLGALFFRRRGQRQGAST